MEADYIQTAATITNPKGSTFGMDDRKMALFDGNTLLEDGNDVTALGSFLTFSPDSTPAAIYCGLVMFLLSSPSICFTYPLV